MQPTIVEFDVRKPINEVFEIISDIAHYSDWAPQSSWIYYGTTITSDVTKGLNTSTTLLAVLRLIKQPFLFSLCFHPTSIISYSPKTKQPKWSTR